MSSLANCIHERGYHPALKVEGKEQGEIIIFMCAEDLKKVTEGQRVAMFIGREYTIGRYFGETQIFKKCGEKKTILYKIHEILCNRKRIEDFSDKIISIYEYPNGTFSYLFLREKSSNFGSRRKVK